MSQPPPPYSEQPYPNTAYQPQGYNQPTSHQYSPYPAGYHNPNQPQICGEARTTRRKRLVADFSAGAVLRMLLSCLTNSADAASVRIDLPRCRSPLVRRHSPACNMSENLEEIAAVDVKEELLESDTIHQLNSLLNPIRAEEPAFNVRLIQEVRSRPYLYDHSNEGYNVTPWRNAAWLEIADLLDSAPESVKTRWKTLRDRFKKEEKKERLTGKPSSWAFQKLLKFVQKSSPKGQQRRNSQAGTTPCISDDEEEEPSGTIIGPMEQAINFIEQEIVRNNALNEATASTSSSEAAKEEIEIPAPPPTKRSRVSLTEPLLSSFTRPSPRNIWGCEDEEDEMFARMIVARLGKLPQKKRDLAKMRMLSALYEFSEGDGSSN